MVSTVLFLDGPPGSGKSTINRALTEQRPSLTVRRFFNLPDSGLEGQFRSIAFSKDSSPIDRSWAFWAWTQAASASNALHPAATSSVVERSPFTAYVLSADTLQASMNRSLLEWCLGLYPSWRLILLSASPASLDARLNERPPRPGWHPQLESQLVRQRRSDMYAGIRDSFPQCVDVISTEDPIEDAVERILLEIERMA